MSPADNATALKLAHEVHMATCKPCAAEDAAVREFVESVIEYADDRADAEYVDGRPQGNAEMRLLVAAIELRGKLRREEAHVSEPAQAEEAR